jgi:PAS domain S-box-containing protein
MVAPQYSTVLDSAQGQTVEAYFPALAPRTVRKGWNLPELSVRLLLVCFLFQLSAAARVNRTGRDGDVYGFATQSRIASGMAIRILNGEKLKDIPGVSASKTYVFDTPALEWWRFEEDVQTPSSALVNQQPSLWQEYERYVDAVILIVLAQALVIIWLLSHRSGSKRIEAELTRSSDRLRLAMESGNTAGWDLDDKTGLVHLFGDLPTMFGMESATFTGQVSDFYSYVHPEDRRRVSDGVASARENHSPFAAEFRILWPDGTIRWIVSKGRFEYAKNGNSLRMVGIAIDITQRKKAEEALQRSEQKFLRAFQQSPLAIAITSMHDGRYVDVNETYERLTGWRHDEMIGRAPLDIGLWINPAQREKFIQRLRAEGTVRNLELRIRRRDGQIRTTLGSSELIEFNGEPCALSLIADVTDLKQAEEAERASEHRFRQFFDSLPEYCFMTSANGEILDANPAACNALGYAREELIGKSLPAIYAMGSISKLVDLLEKWQTAGTLHDEEMVIVTKDGQKRTVLLNAGSVKDATGNPLFSTTVLVDVTERKRIQERLLESEDRLKRIVESAMDAIIAVDEDQRVIVFNSAAEQMFGCQAHDAIGAHVARFIPERFRAAHEADIRHLAETGVTNRAARGALCGLRATGEEFPIEASVSQTEAGGKKLFTVIIRDTTERKQAEEARFRHAAIVESSDDAIMSLDLNGVITSWNAGAQRMYGYTESEALGRKGTMIIPPELREEEAKVLQRLRTGEKVEHHETVRLSKEGKRIDVSLTISPLRDSTGNIFGVSKIARDITLSKKAEAALRESEERFRHVANAAPVMIWMSGPDKLCTYFNQTWLNFTGRPLHAELGNGWAQGVHPDDLEGCLKTYVSSFDRREIFEMEYRLRRHDGEYRWVFDRGAPRFTSDGSFAGYIGSCIDVTERKLAEEALSSVSRKLIEAHEEERTWIAREMHDDFNQRIALLKVNLDRLKQGLPASAVEIHKGIEEASEQVSNLGSEIQALSHRLHSSKLEYLGLETAAASFCRELSEEHGADVEFHSESVPKHLPQEIALCLFRVLQESLQNALKHSGSKRCEVSLKGTANKIELTVRDSGVGFDLEEAITKHGLGLISMKERLKLVQGELFVDSLFAQGTVIRATVPLGCGTRAAGA